MTEPIRMEDEQGHVTERILDLTLEIVCLLTREKFAVVKMASVESLLQNMYPAVSGKWGRISVIESPHSSIVFEKKNDEKILEVTQKIIDLLTGEVPIRCQDVSSKERIEQHEDPYEDAMMEKWPPLKSPAGLSLEPAGSRESEMSEPIRMEDEQSHVTERILDLTLEIVCLLTREKFAVVKMASVESLLQNMYPAVSGKWGRSSVMESPHSSIVFEKKNDEKILEVTQKIIDLLTGEVPLRCQDVSSKERIERHKDPYKDAMMEKWPPLKSPDLSKAAQMLGTSGAIKEELESLEEESLVGGGEDYTKVRIKEEGLLGEDLQDDGIPSSRRQSALIHGAEERSVTDVGANHYSFHDEIKVTLDVDHLKAKPKTEDGRMLEGTRDGSVNGDGPVNSNGPKNGGKSGYGDLTGCGDDPRYGDGPKNGGGSLVHTEEKPSGCSDCAKCSTRKSLLLTHQRNHSMEKHYSSTQNPLPVNHQIPHIDVKPYSCSECGKCFSYSSHLTIHKRIHTGEKPYTCSECGKSFAQKSLLTSHQRSHTGVKPYACSECGKCFSQSGHLTVHKRVHSGEKPHSCLECGKSFNQKSLLTYHQRIHTGERPYACSECGKCFTHRANLAVHQRIHLGEKPFSCAECGKSFVNKWGLITHQRTHTGEQPYSCPDCGKCFSRGPNLLRHQRVHWSERSFIN